MLARLEKPLFALGVLVLVFLAGMAARHYEMAPFRIVDSALDAGRDWRSSWKAYLGIEPVKHLRRASYEGAGLVTHVPEKAYPGVTLMTGLFDREVALSLRAMDGKELHRWRASFTRMFPNATHLTGSQTPLSDWDTHLHGAILYRDGSVVFNFENRGLVKVDRCDEVLWRLPYRTHHAVFEAAGGNLWVPGRRSRTSRLPGVAQEVQDEVILELSPDGKLLREISILESIFRSHYEGVLFPVAQFALRVEGDAMHLNHIEVLSPELAPAFPMFRAGDILVSLRNLNLLMVLDGETTLVKWAQTGPWLRQHEPHFQPNGRIRVFDNRPLERFDHAASGGPSFSSRILEVDPASGQVNVLLEGTKDMPFYSGTLGKHQLLPNGNLLIIEPMSGRAFEVTPERQIVWEFINRFDERRVAIMEQATRYPPEYGEFAAAACPPPS